MKTPRFWLKKSLLADLLLPFSVIYFICHRINLFFKKRSFKQIKKLRATTILIGNATAGGGGKTPSCIAISEKLKKSQIAFLTKAYNRESEGEFLLKKDGKYDAIKMGDEPVFLSKFADVIITENRADSIIKYQDKYDYIIIDDGFLDVSFKADINILAIDGYFAFGNEYIIPAGPMRDKLDYFANKADFFIITGVENKYIREKLKKYKKEIKLLEYQIKQKFNEEYIAFAGIAYPEKFFIMLDDNNIKISKRFRYPDHHKYSIKDIENLIEQAEGKKILTTQKDFTKIPKKYHNQIKPVKIDMKITLGSVVKLFL